MISIIIPTLNEERVIGFTLQSLRRGIMDLDCELIISDGGSVDNTVSIAKKYADRVLAHSAKERTTIAKGRNEGAKAARGDCLVFLDADVRIPEPQDFFERALKLFDADPRLLGITANLRVYPEGETWTDRLMFGLVNLTHRINNNVFHAGSASGEFQMVRARAFRDARGYREDLSVAEDIEFFRRLARLGRTRFVSTLTVFHSGRRAHVIGWPRLLFEWLINWLSVTFLKRSAQKEWRPIR